MYDEGVRAGATFWGTSGLAQIYDFIIQHSSSVAKIIRATGLFTDIPSGAALSRLERLSARFTSRGFFGTDAENLFAGSLKLLTTRCVTAFCGPPTIYRMLILEDISKYDYSGVSRFISAGEPLNPEVIRVWQHGTGRIIHEGYGQTESTVLVANYPFLKVKPGSMGKPVPDLTVEILDEDYKPVPAGEVGYICVKDGPARPVGIFDGYLEDPDENAKVFQHGWYNTGDKAMMDEEGYFTFVGRGDDIIKAAGYRIGPFEVESLIQDTRPWPRTRSWRARTRFAARSSSPSSCSRRDSRLPMPWPGRSRAS